MRLLTFIAALLLCVPAAAIDSQPWPSAGGGGRFDDEEVRLRNMLEFFVGSEYDNSVDWTETALNGGVIDAHAGDIGIWTGALIFNVTGATETGGQAQLLGTGGVGTYANVTLFPGTVATGTAPDYRWFARSTAVDVTNTKLVGIGMVIDDTTLVDPATHTVSINAGWMFVDNDGDAFLYYNRGVPDAQVEFDLACDPNASTFVTYEVRGIVHETLGGGTQEYYCNGVLELTLTGTDITDPLPAGIGGQPHASVFVTKSNANNGGVHIDYIGYDFEERYGR